LHLVEDFDYKLPKELIAQYPVELRDSSRLMVLDGKEITHRIFHEICDYFENGDVIVLNNTKVIPARLNCIKSTGGRVELLVMNLTGNMNKPASSGGDRLTLECLVKGRIKEGTELDVVGLSLKARIDEHIDEGRFYVTFKPSKTSIANGKIKDDSFMDRFVKLIGEHGTLPLPPYIKAPQSDLTRYQTVYSSSSGSIAAPTAGLHFTPEILKQLEKMGVTICYITLHISYGTFKPVRAERVEDHKMDYEYYQVTSETAEVLAQARTDRRLTAVGTTSVRTLESINSKENTGGSLEGITDLFIYPGYTFRAGIDRLITNFHFPKSTLLMLISAFAGTERIRKAYDTAIKNKYRFYSFGDAMLIQQPG
jgi:S-adenosylmethionine:tRNA ribosyltransferase-isomerase